MNLFPHPPIHPSTPSALCPLPSQVQQEANRQIKVTSFMIRGINQQRATGGEGGRFVGAVY